MPTHIVVPTARDASAASALLQLDADSDLALPPCERVVEGAVEAGAGGTFELPRGVRSHEYWAHGATGAFDTGRILKVVEKVIADAL